MITKSFLQTTHRDQGSIKHTLGNVFLGGTGGVGGDEANRGGQSHPGPVCSSHLAEAGTPRHEKFLPLNAEVPVELGRAPALGSCFLTLARMVLEVSLSISGGLD